MKAWLSYIGKVAIFFFFYVALAKFGLSLHAVNKFATVIWPPTGISLVFLFLFGIRFWPAIILGASVINFLTGAPLFAALGIGIGNALEAVMGALLLKKFGFRPSLQRLQDIFILVVFAGFLSTFLSATIGVSSLAFMHVISFGSYLRTWTVWWVGDMMSNIIIAPLFFVYSVKEKIRLQPIKIIEGIFLFSSIALVSAIVFADVGGMHFIGFPVSPFIYPLLIWVALRFSQRVTLSAICILTVISVWGLSTGFGPFAQGNFSERLFLLQSFLGISAITAMVLAAVVAEKKQSEKRKDEFIALASHELRTPLTSLKLFSQFLSKQFTKKGNIQETHLLGKMDKQIANLIDLVNGLLDLSRIQVGKITYALEVLSLNDIMHETVETVQRTTKTHTLTIQGKTKARVLADRERISQVLTNLLTNAVKFSPNAHKIIISSKQDTHRATVCVRDYGIGISKHDKDMIFERFFQTNNVASRTYPGLGLGLYIASDIIKHHKGRIWVKSQKGKGTIFCFSLPI